MINNVRRTETTLIPSPLENRGYPALNSRSGTSMLSSFSVVARDSNTKTPRDDVSESIENNEDGVRTTSIPFPAIEFSRHGTSAYATWLSHSQLTHPRNAVRIPYRRQIAVIPLDDNGRPLIDQAVLARGRDLSAKGISIVHRLPQFHRSFWIGFVEESTEQTVWRVEMKWCRFTRQGDYVSGGKLLHAVPTDAHLLSDWKSFPDG